ncbi:sulfotransferase domain-containing protein [Microbulbifer sp. SAOS-129_SWC]|uniref:sulfotransferase domain-containing protein n=1 Tax=Microbulbifer sp. SAOS-129_SWC TaxID=3145235 RepID=UPI0032176AC1
MNEIKLVYIVGYGRVGSTLFGNFLAATGGCVNVGEMYKCFFDEDMYQKSLPCGCGDDLPRCSFWSKVDFDASSEVRREVGRKVRNRHIFRNFKTYLKNFPKIKSRFKELNERLSKCCESNVVVDSSKNPAFLKFLVDLGAEPYVIHLVRRPSDVIRSWSKSKRYLKKKNIIKTIFDMAYYEYCIKVACKEIARHKKIFVKYEDFIESPESEIERVAKFIGEPLFISRLEDDSFDVPLSHSCAGNPSKLDQVGRVTLSKGKSCSRRSLSDVLLGGKYGY